MASQAQNTQTQDTSPDPTLRDMLQDPTFYTLPPEKQKYYVSQYDKKFADADAQTQNNFLKAQAQRYRDTTRRNRDTQVALPSTTPNGPSSLSPGGVQDTQPAQPAQPDNSLWGQVKNVAGSVRDLATTTVAKAGQYTPVDVAQNVASAVTGGYIPAAKPLVSDEKAQQYAKYVVPQTATEAGLMAGTLAAGPALSMAGKAAPALAAALKGTGNASRLIPAVARVAGATVGGAAGGSVGGENESAGTGALTGLLAGTLGEGASYAAGKVARSLPGAAKRIANKDAARIGQDIEAVTSTSTNPAARNHTVFGDIGTANDLNATAAGKGLRDLGTRKASRLAAIERALGQDITVPSLSSAPVSLTEANEQLSEIGSKAFSKNPLDRTVNGIDQRRLYGKVRDEIQKAIDAVSPDLGTHWHNAQRAYAGGRAVLDELLRNPGIYTGTGKGMTLNTSRLQALLRDPDIQAELRAKLGDAGFDRIVKSITRGAPLGSQDILANERAPLSARSLLSLGLRGSPFAAAGHAVAGVPGAIIGELLGAAALPNSAARYVGKAPYVVPGPVKTAVDIAAEKGLSAVNSSRPGGRLRSLLGIKKRPE